MSTLYPVTFHFLASAMADAIRASGCLRSDSIVAVEDAVGVRVSLTAVSPSQQESEAALTELQAASETQGAELVRAQADLESIRAELAGRVEAEEVARTALETAKQEALSAREEVGARERSLEEAQARNAQERTDLVGQLGVATTTAEQARTELAEARSALQGCQNEREVLEGKVGEGREARRIGECERAEAVFCWDNVLTWKKPPTACRLELSCSMQMQQYTQ